MTNIEAISRIDIIMSRGHLSSDEDYDALELARQALNATYKSEDK